MTGAARRRAADMVDEIAGRLARCSTSDATLAGGAAGLALFFSYLAECTGDEGHSRTALRFLETAIEEDAGGEAALFEGRTGVSWALAHLDGRLFELGGDDPNSAMDSAVLELLETPIECFDLVSGLTGLGVYALERLPRPAAQQALERIVGHLEDLAEDDGGGARWFTPATVLSPDARSLSPHGHWDLGMAHGGAGVVALLGHVRAAGAVPARAERLLDAAVTWLLSQQLPPSSAGRFAAWLAPDQPSRPARTAWCYGDPGVAAALLAAGRRFDAVDLATAAARRPAAGTGVVDAGLCHGAAGLLHVFNRLHHETGEGALADAARRWFEATLALPATEAGFLEGQAGLGLALLAAVTDVEPAWDRILLLSGPKEELG